MAASGSRRVGILAVTAALAGALIVPQEAPAVDEPVRKMARQMDVMTEIIDHMLVDSPNFFVRRDDVRAIYIAEFGAVFSFGATLVQDDFDFEFKQWEKGGGFRVEHLPDGTTLIVPRDDDDDDESEHESGNDNDDDSDGGDSRNWRDRRERGQERFYKRGKTEFVDLLLDYGDTMTTLANGQWVAIVGQLNGEYFERRKFSRVVLKAKIDDLRAHAAGKLNEEETVKRIVVEEY